jgi:predicted RNA binding protein YcfA (HicA-like mRNA interferase family)
MPRLGPIKRKDLIQYLRMCGFEGPYSGGKHLFMIKEQITVRIPNPHQSDIGVDLLARILRHAGITRSEWEEL